MTFENHGSVLLVEDDVGVSVLERRHLERAGFLVLTAGNADEAEVVLGEYQVEILILDNRLPNNVDGLDFYQRIRAAGHKQPVIMVTGFSDEATAIRALKTGVRDFISKSSEFLDYLPEAVERVLKQTRMERQLAESEARYRKLHDRFQGIFQSSRMAIGYTDLAGRYLEVNDAFLQLTGYSRAELIGKSYQELTPPEYIGEQTRLMEHIIRTGESVEFEKEYLRQDGTRIPIDMTLYLVREPSGEGTGLAFIVKDITERKRAEQTLREKEELQRQIWRNERLESLGTLAGGIAHDLNNVLTPIVIAADLLKLQIPDPMSQSLLLTLQTSAQRGADMVKQILSFARGTPNQQQPIEPGAVIKELGQLVQRTFPKSIDLQLALAPNLPVIKADATQIRQVLMNLCVNAGDAMPNGGLLRIIADRFEADDAFVRTHAGAKPGEYLTIAVEDNGSGIPAEMLDKIFDPFFTTKETGNGTGLGLFNVAGIVKHHGGFLDVRSQPGHGTRFIVYLPALQFMPQQEMKPVVEQQPASGDLILVVDDESAIREIVRAALQAAGYRILAAENGAEAVSVYSQHRDRIRLVIMDMMMPVMDGLAAINKLHVLDPAVRVVIASGYQRNQSTHIPAFVKGILNKPFTSQVLLQTVRHALA